MNFPCSLYSRQFPECGFSEGKQSYAAYYYDFRAEGASFDSATDTFCPRPRDASSCSQIESSLTDPLVGSVEEFIRNFMLGAVNVKRDMRATFAAKDQEKARAKEAC